MEGRRRQAGGMRRRRGHGDHGVFSTLLHQVRGRLGAGFCGCWYV
jgi:hypothetical protein